MADKNTSQPQQNTTAQTAGQTGSTAKNPFAFPFPGMPQMPQMPGFAEMTEMWTKAAGEQNGRVQAMFEEMAKFEEKSHAEAKKAVEEMTRLSLATLDYARELSANMRKAALDNAKRMAEMAQQAKA